ncbi:MAG: transporter [Myxococcales bacterium]|nr:transporter [Myxococcales bacterium]MCB9541529.1 transporter [Myxococcales bacterium]
MRRLALALLLALAAAPRLARACAACACGDPTLTAMGTGKSYAGRLRLAAEWRRRAETLPTAFGDARVTEDRYTLAVAFSPLDALQLAVAAPFVDRTLTAPTLARDRAAHLGDVEVLGRYFLVGARGFDTHQLGLTAALRLPTAPELDGADGPLPLDAQPGTGAFMPALGVWYGLFAHPWSAHTSATVVVPSEGHGALRTGLTGLATAHVQRQWPIDLALRVGLDGRLGARDALAGATVRDSGGATLFATAGLGYSPLTDVLLDATLRWPVYDDRRGGERAEPSLSLAVVWDL